MRDFFFVSLMFCSVQVRAEDPRSCQINAPNCLVPEKPTDRIRSLAIQFSMGKILPVAVQEHLTEKKIIFVGEMHGSQEIPQFFAQLAESLSSKKNRILVVLEIPNSSQKNIDAFLKTGNKDLLRKDLFFSRGKNSDGRSSQAMVRLLQKLSKIKNVEVFCMDEDMGYSGNGQDRDTFMAKSIYKKMRGFDQTLVLSGNIHSRLEMGYPGNESYRPMAYELKNLASELKADQIFNIFMRFKNLNIWAAMNNRAGVHRFSVSTEYSQAVPWESYFLVEEGFSDKTLHDGHKGTVFIRTTKPSFPFK